jgi:protein TonB
VAGLHATALYLLLHQSATPRLVAASPAVLQVSWLQAAGSTARPPAATPTPQNKPQAQPNRQKAEPVKRPAAAPVQTTTAPAASSAAPPESTAPASDSSTAKAAASAGSRSGESGAGLEAPRFDAGNLANPAPDYPLLSRKLGEKGKVLLRVHVTADGRPQEVLLHQSSGYERLDAAASDVLWRWKFVPGQRDGIAVPAWVVVPINFILRRS